MSAARRAPRPLRFRALGVAALAAVLLPVVSLVTPLVPANAAGDAGYSSTKTLTREHVQVDGGTDVADTRSVTVKVDQTTELRNRQEIGVSWSGAHPTGGVADDPTSAIAAIQEYPVVVMECRGVDSASAPASQRISPDTCWTQTAGERYVTGKTGNRTTTLAPFRYDRYGAATDHALVKGAPSPMPCGDESQAQRWLPFRAQDGEVYAGGPQGCAGLPPEATKFGDPRVPGNTTYGVTNLNGSGSTSFVVQSADTNASVGCSVAVKCSLVVIPIMGLSCDVSSAAAADQATAYDLCTKTGVYTAGDRGSPSASGGEEDLSVAGALWWSASNWRNRFSVPITFAPSSSVCGVGDDTPTYMYGSELMTQAMSQWQPYFCTTKGLFQLQHVQAGEPAAKNLLKSGSVEAALVSRPPDGGYTSAVSSSPVAFSGFAITFRIDGTDGRPITSLKMNARLLAKLLTESYPGVLSANYPDDDFNDKHIPSAMRTNPRGIDTDPEFRALNPTVPKLKDTGSTYDYATQMLVALSSESDLMYALTSYINSDKSARAWLDGDDSSGMTVNPNYRGIDLPVERWPLLDSFVPDDAFWVGKGCEKTRVPWLPAVAAPVSALATVTQDMQFSIGPSQVQCVAVDGDDKLASPGRESVGRRFLIGVTSIADAQRYKLPMAALVTGKGVDHYVAPTPASLANTAKLLTQDKTTKTWPIPYDTLRTSGGNAAYPGAMVISADIPTDALEKADAAKYGRFLQYAVSDGQVSGTKNGQLPAGYLPLTAANGLGALAAYTKAQAVVVATQNGKYAVPQGVQPAASTPSSGGSSTGGTGGTGVTPSNPTSATSGPAATSPAAPTTGATTPTEAASSVHTSSIWSGIAGTVFPALLGLALLCGLAAPATVYGVRRRAAR